MDESLNVLKESKNLGSGVTNVVPWKKNTVLVGTLKGRVYALDKRSLSIVDFFDVGFSNGSFFGKSGIDDGYFAILSSRNRLHLVK